MKRYYIEDNKGLFYCDGFWAEEPEWFETWKEAQTILIDSNDDHYCVHIRCAEFDQVSVGK